MGKWEDAYQKVTGGKLVILTRYATALLVAMTVIHVVGPVIYRKWDGCWYLGISPVNVREIGPFTPGGICVSREVYERTSWLSWFDGYGESKRWS